MIMDTLSNRHLYEPLQRGLRLGFEYLAAFDPATPDGRYPIDGEQVFALVQSYDTGPATERRFETATSVMSDGSRREALPARAMSA